MKYLTGVAMGVLALILASGFVVIPLFGKIQTRILELMKLFFSIDTDIKQSVIKRIKAFQTMYFQANAGRTAGRRRKISLAEPTEDSHKVEQQVEVDDVDSIKNARKTKSPLRKDSSASSRFKLQRGKVANAFGLNPRKRKKIIEELEKIEEHVSQEEAKSHDDLKLNMSVAARQTKKRKKKHIDEDEIEVED